MIKWIWRILIVTMLFLGYILSGVTLADDLELFVENLEALYNVERSFGPPGVKLLFSGTVICVEIYCKFIPDCIK